MLVLAGDAGHGRAKLPGGLLFSQFDRGIRQLRAEFCMFMVVPHMVFKAYDESFFQREG